MIGSGTGHHETPHSPFGTLLSYFPGHSHGNHCKTTAWYPICSLQSVFFSSPKRIIFGAILSLAACLATRAQTTIIAQENFSYTDGSSLAGQNGGTGWTASWVNDYPPGDSLNSSSTGLTYTGLTTGGSAVWNGASGNGISEDSRYLPLQDSGQVYIQFLCQFGPSGGGTPNLRFTDSLTTRAFGLGGNGGTYGSQFSILDSTLSPASNGSSTALSSSLANENLVVARVDYSDNTVSLWVDPTLASFNYQAPPIPDASDIIGNPDFNNIGIYTRSPGTISDLEIFTVPEPTTISLLGAGAVLAGLWRLRIRRHRI